jgi:hypothetical protein
MQPITKDSLLAAVLQVYRKGDPAPVLHLNADDFDEVLELHGKSASTSLGSVSLKGITLIRNRFVPPGAGVAVGPRGRVKVVQVRVPLVQEET